MQNSPFAHGSTDESPEVKYGTKMDSPPVSGMVVDTPTKLSAAESNSSQSSSAALGGSKLQPPLIWRRKS